MPGIFTIPVWIFNFRRRLFSNDRVLETSHLECGLPVFDPAHDPLHPLRRRSRIDVIDNRLDGLGKLSVWIFLFQTPARDVSALARAMLICAVIRLLDW